jgi:hypothetical protein
MRNASRRVLHLAAFAALTALGSPGARAVELGAFTPGNIVISKVAATSGGALDSASPITLMQFSVNAGATAAAAAANGTLTLPQQAGAWGVAISGECGSASEGVNRIFKRPFSLPTALRTRHSTDVKRSLKVAANC